MLFSMEISKIDQKNINNDENLPIFTQGGGGPFYLKTLFEKEYPPPSGKKSNPGETIRDTFYKSGTSVGKTDFGKS